MDYYRKNMKMLKRKDRSLYERLRNYSQSDNVIVNRTDDEDEIKFVKDLENDITIYIEKTRSDDYTIRVEYENNDIYFHSKYDPEKEAEKQIKNFKSQDNEQVFALGSGLGYHLNILAEKSKFDKIIIIEPYMSIFYTALRVLDFSPIFTSDDIIFIVDNKPNLFDIIQKDFSLSLDRGLSFLEHPPSLKMFDKEYENIYQQIRKSLKYKKTNLFTIIQKSKAWRDNMIVNLPHVFESPKADDFFGEFEGIPAICVAAGPSLDKNIDEINKAEGKALIMCVETAFMALIKHDIKPDIVVSMDGSRGDFDNFKTWPDLVDLEDIYLFAELGNYYGIQRIWSGPKAFFTMKRNFSGWIEKSKGEYKPLKVGGTVAHSMVDLAYNFGSNPIVLVGQDLAYEKEKKYVSGINRENMNGDIDNLVKVEGINGDLVYTDKSFKTMITFFNNYFSKRPDRTCIDATEGGAKIKHTEIMKLSEVIENYCYNQSGLNVKEVLNNKFNKFKPDLPKDELEDAINNTLKELDRAINLCKVQLSKIKRMENKLKHVNNTSELSLDKFQRQVKSCEEKLKRLNHVKYCVEVILVVEFMKYEEVKAKFYLDEIQKFKEKLKYYRSYRVSYLEELKKCRNLFIKLYVKDDKREELA